MLAAPAGAVLCAGNLVVDILVRPIDRLRWNTTTWVEAIEQSLGGNGANTAYTLAKLGVAARLVGVAGRDPFGDFVLATLAGAGVDVGFVRRSEAPTAATVGLVGGDGARAFLHRPGASAEMSAELFVFDATVTGSCAHFHLGNPFGLPRLRPRAGDILASARRTGLTTSLDTGWDAAATWMETIGPCLPHLDVLFVNQDEARMLTGTSDPEEAARQFRDAGAGVVVVKLGGEGCAVFSGEESIREPAFDVPVVDTTGAGDCFAGAFLAALRYEASLREAAVFANAVGAMSVESLGAVTGLRARNEVERWMAETPRRSA